MMKPLWLPITEYIPERSAGTDLRLFFIERDLTKNWGYAKMRVTDMAAYIEKFSWACPYFIFKESEYK